MPYAPALYRRTGYHLATETQRARSPGIAGLPPHQQHALTRFVSTMPARALAEFVLEVAATRLGVVDAIALAENWQSGLSAEALHAAGGDRFPAPSLHPVAA